MTPRPSSMAVLTPLLTLLTCGGPFLSSAEGYARAFGAVARSRRGGTAKYQKPLTSFAAPAYLCACTAVPKTRNW